MTFDDKIRVAIGTLILIIILLIIAIIGTILGWA